MDCRIQGDVTSCKRDFPETISPVYGLFTCTCVDLYFEAKSQQSCFNYRAEALLHLYYSVTILAGNIHGADSHSEITKAQGLFLSYKCVIVFNLTCNSWNSIPLRI